MLQAPGYDFLDKDGAPVGYGGGSSIDCAHPGWKCLARIKDCTFRVACDVTNPLCGPMYRDLRYPQRSNSRNGEGNSMERFSTTPNYRKKPDHADPSTQVQAPSEWDLVFLTYTNAVLESGTDWSLKKQDSKTKWRDADFVTTGEGRLDNSLEKAPIGVAHLAKKHDKKVLVAGCPTRTGNRCLLPTLRRVITVQEAMEKEMRSGVTNELRLAVPSCHGRRAT